MFLVFALIFTDGLCCVSFVYLPGVKCRCLGTGTSSIDWAQLSRFYERTVTESGIQIPVL
jgi:hypothetical protein